MNRSSNEAERDRIPHHRRFRDLTVVSTEALQRTSAGLLNAVTKLRGTGINIQPLCDGLADVEAELIRREIDRGRALSDYSPPIEVIRIAHRSGLHIVGVQ